MCNPDLLDKFTKNGFTVEIILDNSPDLSYIGEYANNPDDRFVTIDRVKQGDYGRGQYRYFVTSVEKSERQYYYDKYIGEGMAHKDAKKAAKQDVKRIALQMYERMESYNNGYWHMVGVKVSKGRYNESLWGVESDYEDGIREVIDDLISEVKSQMKSSIKRRGKMRQSE